MIQRICLIFILVWGIFSSCDRQATNSEKVNAGAGAVIPDHLKPVLSFKEETHKFQPVRDGDEVSHEFEFTNTGKSDLLISNAIASCGCTVPDWPKEPIAPGKSGKLKVTFNSTGRSGMQHKSIAITANTKQGKSEVFLEGEVLPKENINQ
jgi:hypothetical protein